MTPPADERPCPAAALEHRFTALLNTQMAGLPIVRPALGVQAVGFRPWQGHWLGVLATPWFMNLVLMPRDDAQWRAIAIAEREVRSHAFPAGDFAFIGSRDGVLGDWQACSLFSPMFDFADDAAVRATAAAALDALFAPAGDVGIATEGRADRVADDDRADRADRDGLADRADSVAVAGRADGAAATPRSASKRDFLFGRHRDPR